jgi:hypothetical protein
MRALRFGIEIETIGQARQTVASAIQTVVGGEVRHAGVAGSLDPWEVVDRRGRVWKAVADSSLNASRERQAEVVSPILRYEDLTELQEVVRAVRTVARAQVDESCGIHVHVDSSRFDAKGLANLAKLVHQQEDLIVAALGIQARRLTQYTQKVDARFIAEIEQRRPRTLADVNRAWYGRLNTSPVHYDSSRYRGLNMHSVWYRGTVEFRWFEGALHAGKVKAYVQVCLALAAKALTAKAATSRKRAFNPATGRYDFRVLLLRLGMIGDEFKTAREHLLANLAGSGAWKNTRPAPAPIAAPAAVPAPPETGGAA